MGRHISLSKVRKILFSISVYINFCSEGLWLFRMIFQALFTLSVQHYRKHQHQEKKQKKIFISLTGQATTLQYSHILFILSSKININL